MKIKIFTIFFLCIAFIAYADSEFMDYMKRQMGEFQQFKEERDREFTDFLKQQWKDYEMFKGIKADDTPKPEVIPEVKEPVPVILPEEEKVRVVTEIPKVVEEKKPSIPVVEKIVPKLPVAEKVRTLRFNFYGLDLEIRFDPEMNKNHLNNLSNESIAAFWEKSAKSDYKILVDSIKIYQKELNLKDWGTVLFVKDVSTQIYPNDKNRANLLTWFLLSKLGYDTRIGIKDSRIYLLIPSDKTLYGITYFTLDGIKYYAIDTLEDRNFIESIKTYDGKYPESDKLLKIEIENPNILEKYNSKIFNFEYAGKKYALNLDYDLNYVGFYKLFPQTELSVFAQADASKEAKEKLVSQLGEIVKGKSEIEASNIILRFVQTAFKYKTDDEQFGYEKYLIPDETIYYPFSDCEDRSILYQFLIKNILGLDIVLLDYPGHVATAINIDSKIEGDFINIDGKKYYVADPTYINANIGMTMPSVKKYAPKVIK